MVGGLRTPAGSKGVMCTTLSSHNTDRETGEESNPVTQHKPAGQNNNPSHSVIVLQRKRSDCFCLSLSHALAVVGGESQTECGHPVAKRLLSPGS